jgi:RNA polymerase sigma-70 factor, ECF subfamily
VNTTSLTLLDRLAGPDDHEAWGRFVELYTPLLLSWCKRVGISDADSADLIQTVFVLLYENLPKFRYDPGRSFRAWLKTVLMNAWRNQLRKNRTGLTGSNEPDPSLIPDTDPRLQLEEAEYCAHLVHRAMRMLQDDFEPTTVRACWEFVVEERPAREVAEELGISVNSVYLAKSRVLRHLRNELRGLID